jgi:hypothetical protein
MEGFLTGDRRKTLGSMPNLAGPRKTPVDQGNEQFSPGDAHPSGEKEAGAEKNSTPARRNIGGISE